VPVGLHQGSSKNSSSYSPGILLFSFLAKGSQPNLPTFILQRPRARRSHRWFGGRCGRRGRHFGLIAANHRALLLVRGFDARSTPYRHILAMETSLVMDTIKSFITLCNHRCAAFLHSSWRGPRTDRTSTGSRLADSNTRLILEDLRKSKWPLATWEFKNLMAGSVEVLTAVPYLSRFSWTCCDSPKFQLSFTWKRKGDGQTVEGCAGPPMEFTCMFILPESRTNGPYHTIESPRTNRTYRQEECLTIVLTSEIGRGTTGMVHRGTLEPLICGGAMPLDVVVRLAFDTEQRDALKSEYEI